MITIDLYEYLDAISKKEKQKVSISELARRLHINRTNFYVRYKKGKNIEIPLMKDLAVELCLQLGIHTPPTDNELKKYQKVFKKVQFKPRYLKHYISETK